MIPSEAIQAAHASIHEQANFEEPVPKFWDPATGRIEFGVRRRASKAVLADIDANVGTYPTVQVSLLKQSHAPVGVAEQNALTRAYPELIALARDVDSSVSLWLVSKDHVCVTRSRNRAVTRAEPESEKENGTGRDGAVDDSSRNVDGSSRAKKPLDPPVEPLRLDARALFKNLAFPQLVRTPNGLCRPTDVERVVRIAVDFAPPNGRPVRRTGTVVEIVTKAANHLGPSETNQGPRYNSGDMVWSVIWDDPRWFGGAWAWLGFVDFDPEGQSGGSSRFSEGEPDDRAEERRREEPILVLAWTCKGSVPQQQAQQQPQPKPKPQPKPRGRGRGRGAAKSAGRGGKAHTSDAAATQPEPEPQQEPYPEWYIVTMICKRQEEWKRVHLTREEQDALGLGRTKGEMERQREYELSAKGVLSKPNWVESWSDSRFRPVKRRAE